MTIIPLDQQAARDYNAYAHATHERAVAAAASLHQQGASLEDVTAAARKVLADAGGFGKKLDSKTRRVVKQVTGIALEPGQGHGQRLQDGRINYRG